MSNIISIKEYKSMKAYKSARTKAINMKVNDISKYDKYSVAELKKKAQTVFNAWIRNRDHGQACISCGSWTTNHASHYFSAGHYPGLRFNEDNVHASCLKCNYYLHGNLVHYREGLLKRIGQERVEKLESMANHKLCKLDRFYLIEIIERYKIKK